MSYWEDIWKLRFNIVQCTIGSKNIKVEYIWSNRKTKKVNEECGQEVNFDDTFNTDNHILSVVSRANEIFG